MTDQYATFKTDAPRFKAVFTDEQLNAFEANHNETWGVKRRLTMLVLSRTGKQLVDGFAPMMAQDNSDAFFEMIEHISEYRDHLKSGADLAETALARLLLVGKYVAERGEA